MSFVARDARGRVISIGDRVESVTLRFDGDHVVPERRGLVIDVHNRKRERDAEVVVELDDPGYPEVTSPSHLWVVRSPAAVDRAS